MQKDKFWGLYRDGVTVSSLLKFMSCPEKFRLSMEEGWSQKGIGGAAQFGNVFHEVLHKVYSQKLRATPEVLVSILKSITERDIKKLAKSKIAGYEKEVENLQQNYGMCAVLLQHYFRNWKKDFAEKEWVAVEKVFKIKHTSGIWVNGKIDGVFKDHGLWLLETKTKGQIEDEKIQDKLNFDFQTMLYSWAVWQLFGKIPKGILYNVARRPQLRRKVGESLQQFLNRCDADIFDRPEHYFVRYECALVRSDIEQWLNGDFFNVINSIATWNDGSLGRYRNSGACTGNGYTCEFLPVCGRQDFTYLEKRKDIFPELVEE